MYLEYYALTAVGDDNFVMHDNNYGIILATYTTEHE